MAEKNQKKPSELPDEVFNAYLKTAMEQDNSKLEMSTDEKEKFMEAMKKPEFTKLMKDYMDEISDPKNRAEQEAYLRQLEADNKVPGHMKLVYPKAGFALKVQRLEEKEDGKLEKIGKLFINICSVEDVEEPSEVKGDKGSNWNLPYSLGPMRHENDKSGNPQPTFDFAMHPKTVNRCNVDPRFQKMVLESALESVEKRLQDVLSSKITLDRASQRVLRGVGCVGGKPAVMQMKRDVPVTGTSAAPVPKKKATEQRMASPTPPPKAANEPKYTIVHRGHIDLSDFVNTDAAVVQRASKRPKELVLRIQLPKVKSAKYLDIETSKFTFKLACTDKKIADYELNLDLPYPVDEENGSAKFDKTSRTLEITLPVRPPTEEELKLPKKLAPPSASSQSLVQEIVQSEEKVEEKPVVAEQQEEKEQGKEGKTTAKKHVRWVEKEKVEEKKVEAKSEEMSLEEILKAAKEASKLPLPKAEILQEKTGNSAKDKAVVAEEQPEQSAAEAEVDLSGNGEFIACSKFAGAKSGYVFKKGNQGLGYYLDEKAKKPDNKENKTTISGKENVTEKAADVTTATKKSVAKKQTEAKPKLLELQNQAIFELD